MEEREILLLLEAFEKRKNAKKIPFWQLISDSKMETHIANMKELRIIEKENENKA